MSAAAQKIDLATPRAGFWERYVRPPHPEHPNPAWHVSPAIDIVAYHFSWVWVLVPMMLIGGQEFYLYVYAVVMGANLAHRHFGLPYAYLDKSVFRTFEKQLTWFPAICILLLSATPLLLSPAGGAIGSQTVEALLVFALLWNFWHVYMQKFGILRLYQAKAPAAVQQKTPAWLDKYFVLCWFPLYFSYGAPAYKDLIFSNGPEVQRFTSSVISFMERYETGLVSLSALAAAGGVGLWLWHEWHADRFRNRARVSAAAGTLLIATALFWTNPVKAYIAFGFSHAVEYMVFVWAFQRRFYNRPRSEPSMMQRLLRHPARWYLGFIAVFAVAGTLQVLWGSVIMTGTKPMRFFGLTGSDWFFYYAAFESLVHFRMDGFLWKMRRPEVRDYI